MLTWFGPLLGGIVVGSAASWAVFKARIRGYEAYIHERIQGQLKGAVATMSQRPELIIRGAGQGAAIVYQCSFCGRQFPLADNVTPKEAVASLYSEFKSHVRQEHPESG